MTAYGSPKGDALLQLLSRVALKSKQERMAVLARVRRARAMQMHDGKIGLDKQKANMQRLDQYGARFE